MVARVEDGEFQHRIQRIEVLIQEIETLADEKARAGAAELVQALLELHGAGLARIMDLIAEAGQAGGAIVDSLTCDDLVASLLLLHGLHPLDLEKRVQRALEAVRPSLRAEGGNVELLGVADGVVRLRADGSSPGWRSSATMLRGAIEAAIYEAAPDAAEIDFEGVWERPPGFIPLSEVLGPTALRKDKPSPSNGAGGTVSAVSSDGRGG